MVDYITSLVIVFMVLGIPDKKGCRFESPRKVHLQSESLQLIFTKLLLYICGDQSH